MIRLHIFVKGARRGGAYVKAVPRVGDEVRLGGAGHEEYFVVKRLVWCLDEQRADGDGRVNMELEAAP